MTMRADRRGGAALEFAIVSVPFLGLVLGLMTVGLNLYLQEALDLALQGAVRQVQLGLVPSTYSAGDFAAKVLCPGFAPYAACSDVTVTLQPVSDFYTATAVALPSQPGAATSFCVGAPGQLMFARVVYLAPVVSQFWPYATKATVNGNSGAAIVSSAGFANENPAGLAIATVGGC